MALCINPACPSPNHPDNAIQSYCQACGANLTLQGRYRVMRLLTDRSGFGCVYEIFERDQPKILKVLKQTFSSKAKTKAIQLFEQEAMVLSRLNHPGVPQIDIDGCFQVIPVVGAEPLHCLVMEKIDGPNLSEWMRQQGNHPISEQQAVQWLHQLVEVLDLVHQQRYFHRDIKPDNIMIRSSGQLVLVDFGAVREMSFTYFEQLEATGGITRISSAGYTPPEQEHGQAVPQSDFFSLGCTFMYLLTGKKPTDTDIYRPMTNEYHWRPFAPQISSQLADFIDRLTAPRVVDRPTSTSELLAKVNQLRLNTEQLNIGQSFRGIESNHLSQSCPIAPQDAIPYRQHPVGSRPEDQPITLPPIDASAKFPNPVTPTASTQAQVTTGPSPSAAAQSDKIYESSAIPVEAEPYPELKEQGHLLTHPDSKGAKMVASSHPSHRASHRASHWASHWGTWRWLALGLGVVAFAGVAVWGGRSLPKLISGLMSEPLASSNPEVPENLPENLPENESDDNTSMNDSAPAFTQGPTLQGHTGAVNSLALSADGLTLVSGSSDRTVRIWDMVTGAERHRLVGHTDLVHTVALSRNGQMIASGGGDAVIKLWDVDTGEAIADLTGHTSSISDLVITADGQTLISASTDKTIRIWDLSTLTEMDTLRGNTSYINSLSLSPDDTLLASASADRTIKLWNLTARQYMTTLTGHNSFVNTAVFSHNGDHLISGGADSQIKVWDLTTYQTIATLDKHTNSINTLDIAPGGQYLVSASADQSLVIWDLATQQPIHTIPWTNTFIETVAIHIKGAKWQLIAGGAGNHTIQVWEVDR